MIGVQVRAEYNVDVLGCRAGFTKAFEIWRFELMKARRARPIFMIASAAIEQDGVTLGADEPGMHAGDQPVVLGRVVVWDEPVPMHFEHDAIKPDQELLRRKAGEPQ